MSLLERVQACLEQDEWEPGPGPDASTLVMAFSGDNGDFIVAVAVREEERQLMFYALSPREADGDRLGAVMELITRANYGAVIGNFEMDLDDGEVRYKVSVDAEGVTEVEELVRSHLAACVLMLDRYLPALNTVMDGDDDVEAALEAVEYEEDPDAD